jgi:hypothetical protein
MSTSFLAGQDYSSLALLNIGVGVFVVGLALIGALFRQTRPKLAHCKYALLLPAAA